MVGQEGPVNFSRNFFQGPFRGTAFFQPKIPRALPFLGWKKKRGFPPGPKNSLTKGSIFTQRAEKILLQGHPGTWTIPFSGPGLDWGKIWQASKASEKNKPLQGGQFNNLKACAVRVWVYLSPENFFRENLWDGIIRSLWGFPGKPNPIYF